MAAQPTRTGTRPARDFKRVVAQNRKARHEYDILDTYEAGLELRGTEVKSLRRGRASLMEAHIRVRDGEAFLEGCHIPPYQQASFEQHDPLRRRKLLLSHHELRRIGEAIAQRGLTAVPLQLYFKGPWAKVEMAVARGRKLHDKRQALKSADARRDMDRRGES